MSSILGPLALTVSTAALLGLPLSPAIRELLNKQDAGPLITRKDDGRIENFAKALRLRRQEFQPSLNNYAEARICDRVEIRGETLFICSKSATWSGPRRVEVPVFCEGGIQLPDAFECLNDLCAQGDLCSGAENIIRALLGEGRVELGEGAQILRWVHSASDLLVGANCSLWGRASAERSLVLSPGCTFERIHAPLIYSSASARDLQLRHDSAAFASLAQSGMGRVRIHGDAYLQAGEEHRGDIVVSKTLELQPSARVLGSVKANGDIRLHEGAEVHGTLAGTRHIQIGAGCFILGPVIAEREVFIDSGVQIGLPDVPTTVSAPRILLAPGSVLHGTVWARSKGEILRI